MSYQFLLVNLLHQERYLVSPEYLNSHLPLRQRLLTKHSNNTNPEQKEEEDFYYESPHD